MLPNMFGTCGLADRVWKKLFLINLKKTVV
jgi:hypothetical protein